MQLYDVVIVGGGPAGLSALYFLSKHGLNVCLVERGESYEKRDKNRNAFNVANGLGGAGLLYDGKYSFSPSASYFWCNVDSGLAKDSYDTICQIVSKAGLSFPKWENDWTKVQVGIIGEKYYKTVYFSKEIQLELIAYLSANNSQIILNTEITSIIKNEDYYILTASNGLEYQANNVILSTGKHGAALLTNNAISCDCSFKLEVGVRVECDVEMFLPYSHRAIDYKLIQPIDAESEMRTFCCCKKGKVLKSYSGQFYSFNGEKCFDSSNKKSNIGLLLRTESNDSVYAHEIKKLLQNTQPSKLSLKDFLCKDIEIIGKNSDIAIRKFISLIIDTDNYKLAETASIYAPEIEYIGSYPTFDPKTLKVENESIWAVGDVSGKYRGLLAALVSGVYAAKDIIRRI